MKLSVVIPVYNEIKTLDEILRRVQTVRLEKEIILVDDASTDGSREALRKVESFPGIKVCYQDKNQGKGAALRRGFKEASGDVIVIQDADLEYDPQEYEKMIQPIQDGRADVVYGSRFLGGPHRVLYFWHFAANQFLTLFSNILGNVNLSDMETCFKMFRREVLQKFPLRSNRFGFEPEFTIKVAKHRFRIYEIPISYSGRSYEEGKKITWWDGVKAMFAILYFRFFD